MMSPDVRFILHTVGEYAVYMMISRDVRSVLRTAGGRYLYIESRTTKYSVWPILLSYHSRSTYRQSAILQYHDLLDDISAFF